MDVMKASLWVLWSMHGAKALFWTEAIAQKDKNGQGGGRGRGGDKGELRDSGGCGQNTNLFIGVHTCKEMATVRGGSVKRWLLCEEVV